jgi:hypothetical protein
MPDFHYPLFEDLLRVKDVVMIIGDANDDED